MKLNPDKTKVILTGGGGGSQATAYIDVAASLKKVVTT